jgi:hypothetical protein
LVRGRKYRGGTPSGERAAISASRAVWRGTSEGMRLAAFCFLFICCL